MELKFDVSLYEHPPQGTEDAYQMALMATERLKLYKLFQQHEVLTLAELESHLQDSPFLHLLKLKKPSNIDKIRRMDYISHWILRIAYSTGNHDFFIRNELRWFKIRFNNMPHEERVAFLKLAKFEYPEPTKEERAKYFLRTGKWFKVNFDFTNLLPLVRTQLYSMTEGFLLVPEHKLVYCALDKLQNNLKTSLEHNYKCQASWPAAMNFIISFLDLVNPSHVKVSHKISLSSLDNDVEHFPLCMKYQYENLRKNHHLRHFSRVQYGLFLKELGLDVDEALEMWRQEFTKKMSEHRFKQEYEYFFKHQYGLKGSKINYKAQSCVTIINDSVGVGEVNGCPFKEWNTAELMERLKKDNVPDTKIIKLKKQHKYKEACTNYFKCLHECESEVIDHPVQYYENSCNEICDIEDLLLSDFEN